MHPYAIKKKHNVFLALTTKVIYPKMNNKFHNLIWLPMVAIICLIALPVKSQQIIVGNGTAISVFSPINRSNDYCVYEVIYLASEINMPGEITHLAFQRVDGTDTALIQNVNIYMMHTAQSQLGASTFDTTGYTLVYSGTFPNDAGSGWREVQLTTPFQYNGTDNLQVLVYKGYQPAVANTPVTVRWYYTNISPSAARARRYYGNTAIDNTTSLSTTTFTSNVRLTFNIGTEVIDIIPRELNLFPNPATNQLTIYNLPAATNELCIYDLTGRKILTCSNWNKTDAIVETDISDLSPGIYFVKIKTHFGEQVSRFIKQ
jgi:hypothetical protein